MSKAKELLEQMGEPDQEVERLGSKFYNDMVRILAKESEKWLKKTLNPKVPDYERKRRALLTELAKGLIPYSKGLGGLSANDVRELVHGLR